MKKVYYIPALAIFMTALLHAQNPPMNCSGDGIIQVCTAADTGAATDPASTVPQQGNTAAVPPTVVPPAVVSQQIVSPPVIPATPEVSYKNGLLTIVAENIPLSQVLHEVSKKTGATLEVPESSATEPVFANLGPASVRDVLVKLLNGTKFNYVMLGSPDTSSDLKKIVLTPSGENTEVAESAVPDIGLPARAVAAVPAAAPQSEEERRNAFMADVESKRAEVMQKMQERYADMAAKGVLRTPEPRGNDAAAATSTPQAAPAEGAESEAVIGDAPTP